MGENVENRVLEYLRRLDKKVNALDVKVDALADDLRETRTVLSGVVQNLASQDAQMLRVETRFGGASRSAWNCTTPPCQAEAVDQVRSLLLY
jgi:hypothetical protein